MNRDALLPCIFRPLSILALSEPLPENVSHEPGDVALMLLGDLVNDRNDPLGAARRRYKEVSDEQNEVPFIPSHDAIKRHVIRPLVEAKQCYVLGMPAACIAQAGLVGEMVVLWRFKMLEPKFDSRPLNEEMQRLIFGQEFDRLRQVQRVNILRAIDSIDETTFNAFDELRKIRNRYLHNMIEPQQDIDGDAREALRHANTLVTNTLDLKIRDGKIVLPPKVTRYIQDILNAEGTDTPA